MTLIVLQVSELNIAQQIERTEISYSGGSRTTKFGKRCFHFHDKTLNESDWTHVYVDDIVRVRRVKRSRINRLFHIDRLTQHLLALCCVNLLWGGTLRSCGSLCGGSHLVLRLTRSGGSVLLTTYELRHCMEQTTLARHEFRAMY